jgi:hypothetical protein
MLLACDHHMLKLANDQRIVRVAGFHTPASTPSWHFPVVPFPESNSRETFVKSQHSFVTNLRACQGIFLARENSSASSKEDVYEYVSTHSCPIRRLNAG